MKIKFDDVTVEYLEKDILIRHPRAEVVRITPDRNMQHLFKVVYDVNGETVSGLQGLFTDTEVLVQRVIAKLNEMPETKRRAAKRKYEENHNAAGASESDD